MNCCKGGGTDGSLFSTFSLITGAGGQAIGAIGRATPTTPLHGRCAGPGDRRLRGAVRCRRRRPALAGLIAGDLSVGSFVTSLVPGPVDASRCWRSSSRLLSCEDAEQVLAMKRDNRLCHGVGSYCSMRLPIIRTCIETTETYCCFNSRLSRIINEWGRAQLGWGGAPEPDCSGFALAQLQALDFSRMDLTEFYAEIAPTLPNLGDLQQRAPAEGQQPTAHDLHHRHPVRPFGRHIARRGALLGAARRAGQAQTTQRIPVSEIKPLLLALAADQRRRMGAHRSRRRLHASPLRCHRAHRDRRATFARPAPAGCAA